MIYIVLGLSLKLLKGKTQKGKLSHPAKVNLLCSNRTWSPSPGTWKEGESSLFCFSVIRSIPSYSL